MPEEEDPIGKLNRLLAAILQRVERVEGKCEQLRIENMKPTMLFPDRREFGELLDRVKKLEKKKH